MSVLRVHRRKRDFTITVNATPRDRRLSARARGVLWFLLSQRDGYPVNAAKMAAEEFPEGRDALERAIRELISSGYLHRRREQNERGQWLTFTDVYETPELAAEQDQEGHDEQPAEDGIPGVGNPGTDNGFSGVGGAAGQSTYAQVAPTTGKPTVGKPGAKTQGLETEGQQQVQEPTAPDGAADQPEVLDAELIEDPSPERETAQTVLAAYIDWRREQNIADPDKRTRGILAKQLGEAFDAGHPPETVKRGLWCWHQSAQHPATLCSFVDAEARSGGGNGHGRLSEHERRRLASVQELLNPRGAA